MTTKILCFENAQTSLNEFEENCRNLSIEYNSQLKLFTQERDRVLNVYNRKKVEQIIFEHNRMIENVLHKILEIYKPNLSEDFGIFWSGSHARGNSRLLADYDLNFIYPDEQRDKYLPIEEQICCMLTKVTNRSRDVAHSPIIGHFNNAEAPTSLIHRLIFKDGFEDYLISPGLESLMNRMHLAGRSKEKYFQYLVQIICKEKDQGYSASYKTVFNPELVGSLFEDLYSEESSRYQTNEFKDAFVLLIDKQLELIQLYLDEKSQSDMTSVRNIKQHYKKEPIDIIFSTLAIARRKAIMQKKHPSRFNLEIYSQDNTIADILEGNRERFFDSSYEYLWNILRLETACERLNIRFGMHSKVQINDAFHKVYISAFGVNDFYSYHDQALTKLYDNMKIVLKSLK